MCIFVKWKTTIQKIHYTESPYKKILEQLVLFYGFDTLGELIKIKSFTENPTIKSSLNFLRKTDWARKKVEDLYIRTLPKLSKE